MTSPYAKLGPTYFWKPAVADRSMFDIADLWNPKFGITKNDKVATYGSCFAQHIGRALKSRGYRWLITETVPPAVSDPIARKYNYGIFSSRTANIYTTSQLKQWVQWCISPETVPEEYWRSDDRYIDPFRPRIEPAGFSSLEELRQSQTQTLQSFRDSIVQANYFVFTLGLTESWINTQHGYEYPMCPGTAGGVFQPEIHQFENQGFNQIRRNLDEAIELMKQLNPHLKFVLTVSPVPLTATMSGRHVAVATMASKSILRAVADDCCTQRADVDYFPSYEIINSPVFRGVFFEPNMRSVNPHGVALVMDHFFTCLQAKFGGGTAKPSPVPQHKPAQRPAPYKEDLACEEELLELQRRAL